MKKALLFAAALATLAAPAMAQRSQPVNAVSLRDIVNDPQFIQSFAYDFAPRTDVEPKIEDSDVIKFFQETLQPLIQQQNFTQALQQLQDRVRAKGQSAHAAELNALANLYWQQSEDVSGSSKEQYKRNAIRYFEQAIDKFGNYLRAHKSLGQVYMQLDEQQNALPHFVKAVELGDNSPQTFGILGFIHFNNDRYASASAALSKSLVMDPDNKNFRTVLVQTLMAQERYKEAIALTNELLADNPDQGDLWLLIGNAQLGLENIQEAATAFEIARAMGDAQPTTLNLLGNIYINRQMYRRAADAFQTSVSSDTSSSTINAAITAAKNLQRFSAYEETLQLIEAIRSNAESQMTEEQKMKLLTVESQVMVATDRGADAAQTLEEILDIDPMNADALLTLADYYARDGDDPDRAIMYFKRAESLNDIEVKARAYTRHAQLKVRQKEFCEAVELLESSLGNQHSESVQTYLEDVRAACRAQRARS